MPRKHCIVDCPSTRTRDRDRTLFYCLLCPVAAPIFSRDPGTTVTTTHLPHFAVKMERKLLGTFNYCFSFVCMIGFRKNIYFRTVSVDLCTPLSEACPSEVGVAGYTYHRSSTAAGYTYSKSNRSRSLPRKAGLN